MPLPWNEMFGVPRRRVASFEEPVKKLGELPGIADRDLPKYVLVFESPPHQDPVTSSEPKKTLESVPCYPPTLLIRGLACRRNRKRVQ